MYKDNTVFFKISIVGGPVLFTKLDALDIVSFRLTYRGKLGNAGEGYSSEY